MVLPHDLTRIEPGQFKGRAFKKGHVIRPEDVEPLLAMGKEHIFALDLAPGQVHEDEAAFRIARAAAGPGITLTAVCEGRVNLVSARDGLLKVDAARLARVNSIDQVVFATLHTNQFVANGRPVAGTRVVPLVTDEATVAAAEAVCAEAGPRAHLVDVLPLRPAKVGLVITGSEIFHGRIPDKFGPVVRRKFSELGSTVLGQALTSDRVDLTVAAILDLAARGADLVVCTGGMSVDPDDQTPASIRASGARVVAYGSPTFPGAMFLLAYLGEVPVLGLPGCVMYHRASVFDLVAPRLLAGEKLERADIVALGHGGFCAACPECRYPVCPFGKGA
jgi:hypothetical protein